MGIRIKKITAPTVNGQADVQDGTSTYLVVDNGKEFIITCRFHIHGNSICLAGLKGTLHTDPNAQRVYRQIVAPGGGCGLIINDEPVEGLSPFALRGVITAEQMGLTGEILLNSEDQGETLIKSTEPSFDGMSADALDAQQSHWKKTFSEKSDIFGTEPSYPAKKASEFFKKEGNFNILELGSGQGRDTLFFVQEGFQVNALDYSEEGLKEIRKKVEKFDGISQPVTILFHDIRNPLPFEDESFDCCFSHMLYCMALTTAELEFLSEEISRVLKPGGLSIYTARNTGDAHYQRGIHHGEEIWETGGFIVHFFNMEKVKHLAKCYDIVNVEEFEEGDLPRKLFLVTLRKKDRS